MQIEEIEFDVIDNIITDENGYLLKPDETSKKTELEEPEKKNKPVKDELTEEEINLATSELDEEENKDNEEDKKDEDEETNEVYSVLAKELKEADILPDLADDELKSIKTTEDLFKVIEKQFSNWTDIYKANLVNNLISEGLIEPSQVKGNIIQEFSKEEISKNINLQKQIVKNYYLKKGISEKKANNLVENTLDIESEALEFYEDYKKELTEENKKIAESLKQKETENIKKREIFNETIKNNVITMQEFIPGRKLKESDKEIVLKNITPTLNKVNSDLVKYAPILSYLDYYGLLDGKFDKIIKEVETKQVDRLSQILKEGKKKSISDNTSYNKSKIQDIDKIPQIYK
jgi:hypothetical protein